MKRRGKSPPPGARAPGHDKPHAVQDKTGGMGRLPVRRKPDSSRVIVAPAPRKRRGDPLRRVERNDHHRGGQPPRHRIRLIAQPLTKAPSERKAPSPLFGQRWRAALGKGTEMQNAKCKMQNEKWVRIHPQRAFGRFLILHFTFCTLHFALCIFRFDPRFEGHSPAQTGAPPYWTSKLKTAFWACSRFSACVKIVSAFASSTSSVISLPR